MANIRIKDLPADGAPKQTDLIPIDLGSTRHATVKAVVESGRPTASKTEAEAGVEPQKAMTPLTTKQAIDAQVGAAYVPKTVKVNAGSGMTGGGELSGDVTVGLTVENVDRLTKVDGIEAGAQVNAVTSVAGKTGAVTLDANDVGAVPGTLVPDINANTTARHTHANKAILDATTASFLAAEKTKLSGIEAGAQVNTVTSVSGKTGAVTLVKADVGLGNVDNTSDANKPISTATQTSLNAKANSSVTVSAGSGLTGGGNLTANRSIALNAASISSLGKADTALQALGGTTGQVLAKASAADNDVSWITSEAATAVSYASQTLTDAQKSQARDNIGAEISYDTKSAAEAASIPSSVNAIRLNGGNALGDGLGGLYIDTDNGSTDGFMSADSRTWYRVRDVAEERLSVSVLDKVSGNFGNSFEHIKTPIFSGKMRFNGYDSLIANNGYSYIYPQSFYVDEVTGELFVCFNPSGGSNSKIWFVVYDMATGVQKAYFSAGSGTAMEGSIVFWDGPVRKLLSRADNLGKVSLFNVTTLPSDGATLSPISTHDIGFSYQIGYSNGVFAVETSKTPLGTIERRNCIVFWDKTLTKIISTSDLPLSERSGRTDEPLFNDLPKPQGLALSGSLLGTAYGAYWKVGTPDTTHHYIGYSLMNTNGDVLSRKYYKASLFANILTNAGYSVERTEAEGMFISSDGKVHTLVIIDPVVSGSDGQFLILKEGDYGDNAIDFSSASTLSPSQQGEWLIKRTTDAGILLPLTGVIATSLSELCEYVIAAQISSARFYSSHISGIVGVSGASIPTATLVTIELRSGNTCLITMVGGDNITAIYTLGSGFSPYSPKISISGVRSDFPVTSSVTKYPIGRGNGWTDNSDGVLRVPPYSSCMVSATLGLSGVQSGSQVQLQAFGNGEIVRRSIVTVQGGDAPSVNLNFLHHAVSEQVDYDFRIYIPSGGTVLGSVGRSWVEAMAL